MGKKYTCNNGDKFGLWTVIDNTIIVKNTRRYVKVKCVCGTEKLLALCDLKNGRTSGCSSCMARKRSRNIKIGDKFKDWTVIGGPISDSHQCLLWEIQCICGTTRWIQANQLMDPNSCFRCQKCAAKIRTENLLTANGKVGELTLNRFSKLKKSAEKRNIVFDLNIEYLWELYINQNKICKITGDIIDDFSKASLDRIDSSKGYIKGNVQWVTQQANLSKHIMTMNELYEFCKKVLNHANQQPSQPLTKLEGSETNS